MGVVEDVFGTITPSEDDNLSGSREVRRYTISNKSGMTVKVMSYGAAITSLCVQDANGRVRDVILGYDDLAGYLGKYGRNPYFGATIGRVANRIREGKFVIDGENFQLSINNAENHLHGGFRGFDKRLWESRVEAEKVIFSYLSKDGEEGYPGDLEVEVTYEVTPENCLCINYRATTTKQTPVCLTNHSHFNLAGHEAGKDKLRNHVIQINADEYTPVDHSIVAIGTLEKVENTVYDLRKPEPLDKMLQEFPPGPYGYDVNFCVKKALDSELNFVARATNTETRITLEAFSDQPGVQLYTGNFFPDPEKEETPIPGKENREYAKHGAFCLETQNFPNAINVPGFPNAILKPGETYKHSTIFKFSVSESE